MTSQAITLKNPGQTRFGSTVICLRSVIINKHNLQVLASDPSLDKCWNKNTKNLVLSEEFWLKVTKLYEELKPIVDWITKLEGDTPLRGQVCRAFEEIKQHLETQVNSSLSLFSPEDRDSVMQSMNKRKDMCLRPNHYATNILDPMQKGRSLSNSEQTFGIEFIYEMAPKFNLDANQVIAELTSYKMNEGIFGKEYVKNPISNISSVNW